jgi:hypothetical protein
MKRGGVRGENEQRENAHLHIPFMSILQNHLIQEYTSVYIIEFLYDETTI